MLARSNGFISGFAHRPWVRGLSLFGAVWLGGCHSWHAVPIETLGPEPHAEKLRVTTSDWRVVIENARIVDDSEVVGTELYNPRNRGEVTIPRVQVTAIEQTGKSASKTFALGLVAAVLSFLVWMQTLWH